MFKSHPGPSFVVILGFMRLEQKTDVSSPL
jgi:hypothetical protein